MTHLEPYLATKAAYRWNISTRRLICFRYIYPEPPSTGGRARPCAPNSFSNCWTNFPLVRTHNTCSTSSLNPKARELLEPRTVITSAVPAFQPTGELSGVCPSPAMSAANFACLQGVEGLVLLEWVNHPEETLLQPGGFKYAIVRYLGYLGNSISGAGVWSRTQILGTWTLRVRATYPKNGVTGSGPKDFNHFEAPETLLFVYLCP